MQYRRCTAMLPPSRHPRVGLPPPLALVACTRCALKKYREVESLMGVLRACVETILRWFGRRKYLRAHTMRYEEGGEMGDTACGESTGVPEQTLTCEHGRYG